MNYRNEATIQRTDIKKNICNEFFDDILIHQDYYIIDIELLSTYLGRDILEKCAEQNRRWTKEDIKFHVEDVFDEIIEGIKLETKEYLLLNE